MKIKVTQRLTYPEARKIYEQHKPEFTFSKIVQSMPAKPETKTTSTQYSETDCEITESTKVIVARKQKPNTSSQSANSQKSATLKSSSEKQIVPKNQNQSNMNSKQQKQIASSMMPKGSEDPIQRHNRFGVFMDDSAMDTDESSERSGARGSRPRSHVKAPK